MLSFLNLLATTSTGGAAADNGAFNWTSIALIVTMLVAFYFLLIRPQRKKEKEAQNMRNNLEIGDGITTIGGIIGHVIFIKDDTLTIETSSDKTKIRIKKWAVQDVVKLELDK